MKLSDISDLLTRSDSICSLIYYRESGGLSEQTKKDLYTLCTDLRVANNKLNPKKVN